MVVSIKELKENRNGVETLFFPKTHADAVAYDADNTVLDKIDSMVTQYEDYTQRTDQNMDLLWRQWNDALSDGVEVVVTSGYARELALEEVTPNWPWLITSTEEEPVAA